MEVAFLVIAVIGLLALSNSSGGTSVGGGAVAPPPQYVGPQEVQQPTTYTPTPASPYNPPMTPSTGANVNGQLLTGSAQIGTSTLGVVAKGASFVPIAGAVIAAAAAIAGALLAAHEKRLTDARNENEAVDQWIPVYDSFITSVVNAYNSKQITAQNAAQICQQFDQTLYNKFRSFVGQPGTAWSDAVGWRGECNSSCTVGCCIYYGIIGPGLNDISYVLGFPTGKWGAGDPRIAGRTVTISKFNPSKYSSYTRPQYSVTLN